VVVIAQREHRLIRKGRESGMIDWLTSLKVAYTIAQITPVVKVCGNYITVLVLSRSWD